MKRDPTVHPARPRLPLRIGASLALLPLGALLAACATGTPDPGGSPPGDDAAQGPSLVSDDAPIGDEVSAAPVWPGADAAASPPPAPGAVAPVVFDAGAPDAGPFGPAPDGGCVAALGPGALIIDELMIESVAGSGDYGEWIEVRSTADCALDLGGLHGDCPVGMKLHTFDITGEVWLLPRGTFLVADSADPVINHDLPGPLVTWAGEPGDVLRNLGGTVTLSRGDQVIDTLTFPSLRPKIGATVAFPSDCPLARRSDWSAWRTSTASWFPGFRGTPNAPNDDVGCP